VSLSIELLLGICIFIAAVKINLEGFDVELWLLVGIVSPVVIHQLLIWLHRHAISGVVIGTVSIRGLWNWRILRLLQLIVGTYETVLFREMWEFV